MAIDAIIHMSGHAGAYTHCPITGGLPSHTGMREARPAGPYMRTELEADRNN